MANNENRAEWRTARVDKPKEFESVLMYVPSEAPMPEVMEGYRVKDNIYSDARWGYLREDVVAWTDLPFPSDEDKARFEKEMRGEGKI